MRTGRVSYDVKSTTDAVFGSARTNTNFNYVGHAQYDTIIPRISDLPGKEGRIWRNDAEC